MRSHLLLSPTPPQELYQLSKERADFTVVAADEGSSPAGGSSGENEGASGPCQKAKASPEQPSTSARKARGKLRHPGSGGGKERGRWGGKCSVGGGSRSSSSSAQTAGSGPRGRPDIAFWLCVQPRARAILGTLPVLSEPGAGRAQPVRPGDWLPLSAPPPALTAGKAWPSAAPLQGQCQLPSPLGSHPQLSLQATRRLQSLPLQKGERGRA